MRQDSSEQPALTSTVTGMAIPLHLMNLSSYPVQHAAMVSRWNHKIILCSCFSVPVPERYESALWPCVPGLRPDATWIEVAMSQGIHPTNALQQLCPAGHHNSQGRLAAICYCHGSTTLKKNSCFHNFTIYALLKEQYIITFQQDTGYIHVKMTKAPATSMCGDMRHPLG